MEIKPAKLIKLGKRVGFYLYRTEAWSKFYRCIYEARGRSLGTIKFDKRRDVHVYFPTSGITLTPVALDDIVSFLAEVNRKGGE